MNVSTDLTNDSKKGTVSLQLLHTRRADTPPYNFVCDLGSFAVPESRFHAKDKATGAVLSPKEALEDEYGFLEDSEHKVLFVGGGPLGGKDKLTVLEWTDKTLGDLTANHIKMTFTDEELGGAANIAGAVRFTEGVTTHNYSSGGCGGSSGGGYTVSSKRYILVGELASKRLDGSDLIPYIRKRVTKSIDLTNNLDEAIDILPGLTSGDVVSLCPGISNIWFG